MKVKAHPVLKWAGGKRQLLSELLLRVPARFGAYHEFFFGGGALFFELYNQGRITEAFLSDINPKLMNVYQVVKEKPYDLIEELRSSKYFNDKSVFYKIRSEEPIDTVQQAARFIYLNKTAFNGLYRENSLGKFNVPFGKYEKPNILGEEGLLAASEALSCATLLCGDFSEITKYAKKGDFAYFDPPYYPLNSTSSFTAYTSGQFGGDDQVRLKEVFNILSKKGVKAMLSNSYTDFVNELFNPGEGTVQVVKANRAINCVGEKRGKVKELVFTNYELLTLNAF